MTSYDSQHSGSSQPAAPTFRGRNEAPAPISADAEPDPNPDGRRPCTCGICDGVEIELGTDLHTGEVKSFERMSRKKRCPNCGGWNLQYRRSYTAHVADVVNRVAGTRNVYALHITLDAETVRALGIAPEATYEIWTDGGPWTRARRNIGKRDDHFRWMGSLSARPSDGLYHLHLVIVTRLSVPHLREALHVSGLNSYLQAFGRSETADSKQEFAAMWAAYAFDNAARGASARFVASRKGGEGYNSTAARERREAAVQDQGERRGDGPTPARGLRSNEAHENIHGDGAATADFPDLSPHDAEKRPQDGERAPPVELDGGSYRDRDSYFRAVRRGMMARTGTRVHIHGEGAARLVKIEGGTEGLTCTVAPEGEGEAIKLPWTRVRVSSAPLLRTPSGPFGGGARDTPAPESDEKGAEEEAEERDPTPEYMAAKPPSIVQDELADGRRHVEIKNHRTGEVTERILPPPSR